MSRLTRQVRLVAVVAIFAVLLTTIMGVVPVSAASTAAVAISASPAQPAFGVNSTTIQVGCGSLTGQCQLWATKNGQAYGTEVLVSTITGSTSLGTPGPITYGINDGCFNFRVYNGTAHNAADLAGGIDVGHSEVLPTPPGPGAAAGYIIPAGMPAGTLSVCTGVQNPSGVPGYAGKGFSKGQPILDVRPLTTADQDTSETLRFDSGFAFNTDVAQVYVAEGNANLAYFSQGGLAGQPFGAPGAAGGGVAAGQTTLCTTGIFTGVQFDNDNPNPISTDASEKNTNFKMLGGGPYKYTMYSGTGKSSQIGPSLCTYTQPFLKFVNGNSIIFNGGASFRNALVCVAGQSTPLGANTPFTLNSKGYSPAPILAPFQFAGAGTNTYTLRVNVATLPSGQPTPAACTTGTLIAPAILAPLVVTT